MIENATILPADLVLEEEQSIPYTENQIVLLVDEGLTLKKEMKRLEKRFNAIKDDLLRYAMEKGLKEIEGEFGKMVIASETKFEVEPGNLIAWLKKHNKLNLLPKLITVVKKKIEHELGTHAVEEMGVMQRKEYAKCIFQDKEV
jgi:hypothetical protein